MSQRGAPALRVVECRDLESKPAGLTFCAPELQGDVRVAPDRPRSGGGRAVVLWGKGQEGLPEDPGREQGAMQQPLKVGLDLPLRVCTGKEGLSKAAGRVKKKGKSTYGNRVPKRTNTRVLRTTCFRQGEVAPV
jgi:hypothetical protein